MDKKLKILVIGAHPDDCDLMAGGTTLRYAAAGHTVKFLSLTNGNAGHQRIGGLELARRRFAEVQRSAAIAGIEYEVFDFDDGHLTTGLSERFAVLMEIRRFEPDMIFTHRTNDYHADHRAAGTLVQDCSYLIMVPNVCQLVPALRYKPVIAFMHDDFKKPVEFKPDVAIDIDPVIDSKMKMLACHESQMFEWLPYVDDNGSDLPADAAGRLTWLKRVWGSLDAKVADKYRDLLKARYGSAAGSAVRYAEAFEISEYGGALEPERIPEFFPF